MKNQLKIYQKTLIRDFILKMFCYYKNKRILEIGSDFNLNVAHCLVELGAKEVICVNPKFPDNLVSDEPKIKLIKSFGEQTKLQSHSFDIIFGIALLEHVLHVTELFAEIKRLLKFSGVAYLQGNPIYTSKTGHHLWVKLPEIHYHFGQNTNPFEYWEHLCLKTENEIRDCLRRKKIPEEHIPFLVKYLVSDDTSKLPASEIVRLAKLVKGLDIKDYILIDDTPANNFYQIARQQYSEKDLRTYDLKIIATHKIFYILINSFIKKCKDVLFCVKICFY